MRVQRAPILALCRWCSSAGNRAACSQPRERASSAGSATLVTRAWGDAGSASGRGSAASLRFGGETCDRADLCGASSEGSCAGTSFGGCVRRIYERRTVWQARLKGKRRESCLFFVRDVRVGRATLVLADVLFPGEQWFILLLDVPSGKALVCLEVFDVGSD